MLRTSHKNLLIFSLLFWAACDLLKGGQKPTENHPATQKSQANAATVMPDTAPTTEPGAARKKAPPDPSYSVPHPFRAKAALALLYDDVPGASWGKMEKGAQEGPSPPTQEVLFFQEGPEEPKYYAKATAQYPFTQGGKKRILFLTESAPVEGNDFHAATVTIGAAVFTQTGERWQLDFAETELTQNGEYGVGNVGELVQIGPERYGLLLSDGYSGQGLTASTDSIYEIAEDGFYPIFQLTTHEDNKGNCSDKPKEREEFMIKACYEYSAKLEFVPGKDPTYHDLKVTYTGTRVGENDEAVKADREERYTIKDGKYQL